MTLQPGIRAAPVWDTGDGFKTVHGMTPEQLIARWEKDGMSMWDELDKAVEALEALSIEPKPTKPTLHLVQSDRGK